jgi:hypothetical protein
MRSTQLCPMPGNARRRHMIAYLLLVHRYPEQFKRLFKAIYDRQNHYVVHVDKNSGAELASEIRAFLLPMAMPICLTARRRYGAATALWTLSFAV